MTDMRAVSLREAISRLHREKDASYRDAWKKRGEVISILSNIARKVDRLEYVLDGASAGQDETVLDTAIDLLVYCIKYQEAYAKPGDEFHDQVADLRRLRFLIMVARGFA